MPTSHRIESPAVTTVPFAMIRSIATYRFA
jgi:hypothetical protein